jgi:hypothetical protein
MDRIQRLQQFEERISIDRKKLCLHPVYGLLRDLESIRIFMEAHAFAVWDFMSLLKSLQIQLTCTCIPWTPRSDSQAARFINEIVLAEETDEVEPGHYLSHYELYLLAMREIGARTEPVEQMVQRAQDLVTLKSWLASKSDGIHGFVKMTLDLAERPIHQVAAAFLFGREDVIPEMFERILKELELFESQQLKHFRQYLVRHIEIDGGQHGPLAKKLLMSVCGDSETHWNEAEQAASEAIQARLGLWSAIQEKMQPSVRNVHPVDLVFMQT